MPVINAILKLISFIFEKIALFFSSFFHKTGFSISFKITYSYMASYIFRFFLVLLVITTLLYGYMGFSPYMESKDISERLFSDKLIDSDFDNVFSDSDTKIAIFDKNGILINSNTKFSRNSFKMPFALLNVSDDLNL